MIATDSPADVMAAAPSGRRAAATAWDAPPSAAERAAACARAAAVRAEGQGLLDGECAGVGGDGEEPAAARQRAWAAIAAGERMRTRIERLAAGNGRGYTPARPRVEPDRPEPVPTAPAPESRFASSDRPSSAPASAPAVARPDGLPVRIAPPVPPSPPPAPPPPRGAEGARAVATDGSPLVAPRDGRGADGDTAGELVALLAAIRAPEPLNDTGRDRVIACCRAWFAAEWT